eukprot:CAMPEP_0184644218 /NCGR_PEP_ID=MMETSP0308-20130426/982_1 /TAXON_ID=38269 /ORGANISM="Gloeochaete witrockiana, Strain SAG 46.84" /LENGTH=111 /DNA_ID=CAMNT_0027072637 /DNA_START=1735 /DNA_END=2070 /DNA_ORIENTATION=+
MGYRPLQGAGLGPTGRTAAQGLVGYWPLSGRALQKDRGVRVGEGVGVGISGNSGKSYETVKTKAQLLDLLKKALLVDVCNTCSRLEVLLMEYKGGWRVLGPSYTTMPPTSS